MRSTLTSLSHPKDRLPNDVLLERFVHECPNLLVLPFDHGSVLQRLVCEQILATILLLLQLLDDPGDISRIRPGYISRVALQGVSVTELFRIVRFESGEVSRSQRIRSVELGDKVDESLDKVVVNLL